MASNPIILTGTLELLEAAEGKKPRRLKVLAYSGGILNGVYGYGDTLIDIKGLAMPKTITILNGHENRIDAVIGAGAVKAVRGSIEVVVTLAENDQAAAVLALLDSGVELQASVGVRPIKSQFVRGGEKVTANGRSHTAPTNGLTVLIQGELKEISILPLGADSETEVKVAARAAGSNIVEPNEDTNVLTADAAVKIAELTEGHPTIRAAAMTGNWNLERTELEVLKAERSRWQYETKLNGISRGPSNIGGGNGNGHASDVSTKDILAAATLIHCGRGTIAEKHVGAKAANVANDLHCHSMLDIFQAALRLEGQDIPRNRNEMIRAAFSLASLPQALGSSADKVSLVAYKETPATWRAFCKVVPVDNFRTATMIRPSFSGGFSKVGNGGELKHGSIGEQTFSVRAHTAGELLTVTRQNVINDDLGMFTGLAEALGRESARYVSDIIYAALLTNKEFDGATDFFTAGRGNLLTTASSSLGISALGQAIAVLRNAKDTAGKTIDIQPKVLLVCPTLEVEARALLFSDLVARDVSTVDNLPTGNPMQNFLDLQTEPRLENEDYHASASDKAFFVFAGPESAPLTVCFVNGTDGPTIEQVDLPADSLGIGFRGYVDPGVSLSDYRAAVRSDGE